MSGKRKSLFDGTEVSVYRRKLRTPSAHPILSNEERKKYTFKAPYPQHFSFRNNILCYIIQSSPTTHLKLLSSCKFIARLSKILPVEYLAHYSDDENKWKANGRDYINLKTIDFKLWIFDKLCISGRLFFCDKAPILLPNVASALVKHIHKCSLQELNVHYQILTFEELQILVSGDKLEYVEFGKNVVKNDDGSITEFIKVFELLCRKNLKILFHLEQHGFGENTTTKIIDMLSSEQIPVEYRIWLVDIPPEFHFRSFSEFLKANMTGQQHSIDLDFGIRISAAYRNQLQLFIDEVIQMRGIYAHTVPIISFRGLRRDAFNELLKMRNGRVEGILKK